MSDMDVSIRLRLVNNLSKEADRAGRDLKELDAATKKLGRSSGADKLGRDIAGVRAEASKGERSIQELDRAAKRLGSADGADKLKRDLGGVRREADRSEQAVKELDVATKKLGRLSGADKLGRDIAGVRSEASKGERSIRELDRAAKKLGSADGADKLERDLGGVRREADRSEQAVKELDRAARKLNTIDTNAAEKEIRSLGAASRRVAGDVAKLDNHTSKFGDISNRSTVLSGTMTTLGKGAKGAFGALLAFASADAILRGLDQLSDRFKKLDRDVASVAVTAETRTPEAIEKISQSNEKFSVRYGLSQEDVNEARKTYAAAGFGLEQQEKILDPTLRAAKAGDSTGETISQAVIALQQNLDIKNDEVPAVLDMMSKGSKFGKFEVNDMARNFPKLATMYAGTGRKGPQAVAELVAAAQIVNMSSATPDIAANNLDNIIGKLSSPDTVKNFAEFEVNGKKRGVDLPALRRQSEKNGTPYMMDVVDKVMEMTGGDEFLIGELFGDKEAKMALMPLIANRQKYNEFLKGIINDSKGTLGEDYEFVRNRPQEKADRRNAALEAVGNKTGSVFSSIVDPIIERFVRAINPDYGKQERAYEAERSLKNVDTEELRALIDEREGALQRIPKPRFGDTDLMAGARSSLEIELGLLREQLRAAQSVQDRDKPVPADDDLGKSTGQIPVPHARPRTGDAASNGGRAGNIGRSMEQNLAVDMSAAAERSMGSFTEAMSAQGEKAIGEAQSIADRIKAIFGFTVSPVISPTYSGSSGADEKHSAAPSVSTGVKLTQNIYSPNAKTAALRAQREQNRSVRMAQSRRLGDIGPRLA